MTGDAQVPAAAAAPLPTDPAELQRAIEVRQARLAATVDELTTRVSPKEVARRTTARAQQSARDAVMLPDGSLRVERVAAAGAAALALLVALVVRSRRRSRRR